jgi:hypothetical protein
MLMQLDSRAMALHKQAERVRNERTMGVAGAVSRAIGQAEGWMPLDGPTLHGTEATMLIETSDGRSYVVTVKPVGRDA